MKTTPVIMLTSLTWLTGGCASDPSFNLLPPPIYQRGSLEGPARQGVVAAEALPMIDVVTYHTHDTGVSSSPNPVKGSQPTAL